MTIHSAWLSLAAQSRQDTRLAMSTAMAPAANLTSRSGLIPDNGFVLQQVAAMQCQITPGRAYVQGVLTQGAYPVAVDAAVPLTVPDGDPQFGRIDLVVLRIRDDQFDGTGQTAATVELVTGTPSATPVVPAVPAASLGLWQISVPTKTSAGTGGVAWSTATTDLRVYTSGLGGIVPAGTTVWTPPMAGQYSDLNGLLKRWNGSAWVTVYDPATFGNLPVVTSTTRPTGPAVGREVFETDTGRVSLWNGSAWVTAYDPAGGWGPWTTLTLSVSGSYHYRLGPGGMVQLKGSNGSIGTAPQGNLFTNFTLSTSLPAAIIPATARNMPASTMAALSGSLSISGSTMILTAGNSPNNSVVSYTVGVSLDGIMYDLS